MINSNHEQTRSRLPDSFQIVCFNFPLVALAPSKELSNLSAYQQSPRTPAMTRSTTSNACVCSSSTSIVESCGMFNETVDGIKNQMCLPSAKLFPMFSLHCGRFHSSSNHTSRHEKPLYIHPNKCHMKSMGAVLVLLTTSSQHCDSVSLSSAAEIGQFFSHIFGLRKCNDPL